MNMLSQDITRDKNGKLLFQALLVRSLDILSLEEEKALDALLDVDATTMEDVFQFLKSKIPTFDLLLVEEKQKLKEKFVFSSLL
jgi:hypothetical protein